MPLTIPQCLARHPNRAVLQANLDWFNHYLWGDAFPKDSSLLGSSQLEAAAPAK